MTPEEFKAARKSLTLTWGPRVSDARFTNEADRNRFQIHWMAWAFNMNEKTIRVWERAGGRGPHPTAVRALRWMMDDLVRPHGESEDCEGFEFAAARVSLGLSKEQMASILDISTDLLDVWERERGAHPAALRILDWLEDGFQPPELLSIR